MSAMTESVAQATSLPHPERSEIRIESVLHALADPVRLLFVRELALRGCEGSPCGSIELPVTKSTRTHHLRILREAGVINMRPEGTSRISTLRRDDLDALYPGLLDSILTAAR
jgi:DNA-binding transcriptional ArsR family regulator